MPRSELGGAQELVDKYITDSRSGTKVRKQPLNQDQLVTRQFDTWGKK
jgi:hypothetical protein